MENKKIQENKTPNRKATMPGPLEESREALWERINRDVELNAITLSLNVIRNKLKMKPLSDYQVKLITKMYNQCRDRGMTPEQYAVGLKPLAYEKRAKWNDVRLVLNLLKERRDLSEIRDPPKEPWMH